MLDFLGHYFTWQLFFVLVRDAVVPVLNDIDLQVCLLPPT